MRKISGQIEIRLSAPFTINWVLESFLFRTSLLFLDSCIRLELHHLQISFKNIQIYQCTIKVAMPKMNSYKIYHYQRRHNKLQNNGPPPTPIPVFGFYCIFVTKNNSFYCACNLIVYKIFCYLMNCLCWREDIIEKWLNKWIYGATGCLESHN